LIRPPPWHASTPQSQHAAQALKVLVLGGFGFIGSHVASAISERGHLVTVGSRRPGAAGQLVQAVRFQEMHNPSDLINIVDAFDVIVNCVGILRQRRHESYEQVHHLAPAALAIACARAGRKFIHTSALGLHENAKSRFLSSKLRGERAVQNSAADFCIVRPSLIDGMGGFGASWLRMISQWPIQVLPRGATGNIAALNASDLGEAYARLVELKSLAQHREVELGGAQLYRYGEYLSLLRGPQSSVRKPALQISVPNWMARTGSHLCDALHFSPFSYGHWILLQRDNVPTSNRLPELLGREPTPIAHTQHTAKRDFRFA
jgi:uncharacterized protein YbjT (DUF2867 family)